MLRCTCNFPVSEAPDHRCLAACFPRGVLLADGMRCPGPFSKRSAQCASTLSVFKPGYSMTAGSACRQPRMMRRQAAERAHPCRTPSCLPQPCLSKTPSYTLLAMAAARRQHLQKVQPAAGTRMQVGCAGQRGTVHSRSPLKAKPVYAMPWPCSASCV